MIRRFGPPPESGRKYVRRAGAYAILPRGSKVLITCQNDPVPDFQLPGGGIDQGESPIMALHREVLEETGWRISNACRVGAFRRFVYMPEYDLWAEKICFIYVARPVLCLGPPTEPNHSAHWMSHHDTVKCLSNAGDRFFMAWFGRV